MYKQLFSRRTFLKGSAVAIVSAALAGCGSPGSSTTTYYPTYVASDTIGPLDIEIAIPYSTIATGEGVFTELRFKFINNSDAPITLTESNFDILLNGQQASVSQQKIEHAKLAYLFDRMPIESQQYVTGYLLAQSSQEADEYKITVKYPNSESSKQQAVFEYTRPGHEWFE